MNVGPAASLPSAEGQVTSEARYRDLVETSNDLIWSIDALGRWTFLNRSATLRIYGYEPEEMLGRPFTDFQPPEFQKRDMDAFQHVLAGQRYFQYETTHIRKDGTFVELSFNSIVLSDEHGAVLGATGTASDITERKRLEAQLLHSQKIEAMGRIAGGVAHHFNNLINIILGYTERAGKRIEPGHPVAEDLIQIRSAGERAASLTRQLLAFARREPFSPRRIDLYSLTANISNMLQRLIGDRIELSIKAEKDLWPVHADPGQMEQVLVNLAANARDAMPNGGSLTITLLNVQVDTQQAARHPDTHPGPHVLLRVTDTGFGMGPNVMDQIFEPFYTTKEVGKGSGLGLATCRAIVRQAGGFIEVDSRPSRGATFRVYIPKAERDG